MHSNAGERQIKGITFILGRYLSRRQLRVGCTTPAHGWCSNVHEDLGRTSQRMQLLPCFRGVLLDLLWQLVAIAPGVIAVRSDYPPPRKPTRATSTARTCLDSKDRWYSDGGCLIPRYLATLLTLKESENQCILRAQISSLRVDLRPMT